MVDWSLLPKDLLELINGRFETCFETVHLRSVCSLWQSAVSPPSYSHGLGVNSLLPIFSDNSRFGGDKHCILKKIPIFLFRYQTPFGVDCLIVGISESNSCKHKLVSSLPGFGFISEYGKVLNTLSTQIIPLDHNYVVNYYATTTVRYRTLRRSFLEKVHIHEINKNIREAYLKEEAYWKRRSCIPWLTLGDNSKFFHTVTKGRTAVKKFSVIESLEVVAVYEEEDIVKVINAYYQDLFTSTTSTFMATVEEAIQPKITHEENEKIISLPTESKMKTEVKQSE